MDNLAHLFLCAIPIGMGATLTFDLWAQFLKFAFKIPPSNICLVGRWIRYMADGTFTHSNLFNAPPKSAECSVGWISHYLIGITFAFLFLLIMGNHWLEFPTLFPALAFGIITVLAPFFIMQPAFGLGIAASKTQHPAQSRLRSLMNHAAFGFGHFFFGWLIGIFV